MEAPAAMPWGVVVSGSAALQNAALAAALGGRYRLSEHWLLGADAEYNPWYGSSPRRGRASARAAVHTPSAKGRQRMQQAGVGIDLACLVQVSQDFRKRKGIVQHLDLTPSDTGPRARQKRLGVRTIMGILREQGIPDSEARQRISSDPELRAEIEQLPQRRD